MAKTKIVFDDENNDVLGSIQVTTTVQGTSFSNENLFNNHNEEKKIASLDRNYWELGLEGESAGISILDTTSSVPYWSNVVSSSQGIDVGLRTYYPLVCTISLDPMGQFTTEGITLDFTDCSAYGRVIWHGDTDTTVEFYGETPIVYIKKHVDDWNWMEIQVFGLSLPQRRLRLTNIIHGIYKEFDESKIINAKATKQFDITGLQCAAGSAELTIHTGSQYEFLFDYNTPFKIERLIQGEWQDRGTYYVTEFSRGSDGSYNISAQDAIGVLSESYYSGKEFMSGMSARALINDVMAGSGIDVSFPQNYIDSTVYGAILRQTRRNALQQIAFATGMWFLTIENGDESKDKITIARDYFEPTLEKGQIYQGATIERLTEYTMVSVDSHQYNQNPEGDIPIGANRYFDIPASHSKYRDGMSTAKRQKTISVTNATMVTTTNVNSIMNTILFKNELATRCGKGSIVVPEENWQGYLQGTVEFTNGTDVMTGQITKITYNYSKTLKADIEVTGV